MATTGTSDQKEPAFPGNIALLHIPAKKRNTSKKDSPLEKEMRRFNKLVKEIEALQKESDQHKDEDEQYHQLFLKKVHPLLLQIADAQVAFIEKLEAIFYQEKFAKNLERRFVEFAIPVLKDAAVYLDIAKTKLENYIVWQASLFTKADQHPALKEMEGDDAATVNEEEDPVNNFNHQHEWNREQLTPDLDKKSIAELYKELAKQIHPDLEQDEALKHVKEQLMKELTDARNSDDVYAMLLIRQKADLLNKNASENSYSLQLLKKYNTSLKKKSAALKRAIQQSIYQSFQSKESFFAYGKKKQPVEVRIKNQLRDLKELHESLQHNTRIINNGAQLKELLDL